MKDAVDIVRKTIDDITSDLRGALFCLTPVLVVTGLWYFLLASVWLFNFNATRITDYLGRSTGELFIIACIATASMIVFLAASWSAVSWHRKIILSETPRSLFPLWNGRRIAGYFGRIWSILALWLFVMIFLVLPLANLTVDLLPVLRSTEKVILSLGTGAVASNSDQLYMFMLFASIFLYFTIFFSYSLRYSLMLPARAIDQLLRGSDARRLTKGRFLRLFLPLGFFMFFILMSFNVVMRIGLSGDTPNLFFNFLLLVLGIILTHLLGFGILTRLYLHFVPLASKVHH